MQQADPRTSSAPDTRETGKSGDYSGQPIIQEIERFAAIEIVDPLDSVRGTLFNLATLLAVVDDTAEELDNGISSGASTTALRDRSDRMRRLLWIARDELNRTQASVDLVDGVIDAHMITRGRDGGKWVRM